MSITWYLSVFGHGAEKARLNPSLMLSSLLLIPGGHTPGTCSTKCQGKRKERKEGGSMWGKEYEPYRRPSDAYVWATGRASCSSVPPASSSRPPYAGDDRRSLPPPPPAAALTHRIPEEEKERRTAARRGAGFRQRWRSGPRAAAAAAAGISRRARRREER